MKDGFLDVQFPTNISKHAMYGVEFSTNINQLSSGVEVRSINRSNSREKFILDIQKIPQKEVSELVAFFRIVNGMAYSFRFRNWLDYSSSKQKLEKVEVINNSFQLYKGYEISNLLHRKKITKPIRDSLKLFIVGSEIEVSSENYLVDWNSGIITLLNQDLVSQAINGLMADFDFDIEARFNSDVLFVSNSGFSQANQTIQKVEIMEILS